MTINIRILLFGFALMFQSALLLAQYTNKRAMELFDSLEDDRSKKQVLIKTHGDSLLKFFKATGDQCRFIKTLLYQESRLCNIGEYEESLKTLALAQYSYNQTRCDNEPIGSDIYASYANLYYTLNENKKVAYYIKKGIELWKPIYKDRSVLMRLYILKGSLNAELNRQIYYYNLAYQLAYEDKNEKFLEYALNVIGTAYAIGGNYKEAKNYLKQSLTFALKRKAYGTLSGIYNNLAGLTSNPSEITNYLDSSYYYASLSGSLEDLHTSLINMAYNHYQVGNFKSGYDVLWESMVIKDSLFNQDKINAFANMEQKYESVKKTSEIAILKSQNEIATLQSSRRLGISIGLAFILTTFIVVSVVFFKQNKRKQKLNIELSIEKKKSDDLLLNILPEEVADELKQTGMSKARLYNHVTVLFTDFVNFTGISENLSPTELVQEIHKNFTAFDAIIEKHGLEKIKTIGDAYLAVCGLPHEINNHAQRVVNAALDIQSFMLRNEGKFQIRIGIHSGPVVAGIVGVKKYAYDIWGDTVNMANRMESNSEVGKINISGATYGLVSDNFECTYRGKINAKNKGEVDMYFVEDRKINY